MSINRMFARKIVTPLEHTHTYDVSHHAQTLILDTKSAHFQPFKNVPNQTRNN